MKRIVAALAIALIAGLILYAWKEFRRAQQLALCDSLWSAAEDGQNDSVKQALRDGADPNCMNGEALRRARARGHMDTVEILKRAGAKEH